MDYDRFLDFCTPIDKDEEEMAISSEYQAGCYSYHDYDDC